MHCLEVIVKRNAEAAGREAGHADNDSRQRGDCPPNPYTIEWDAWWAAYQRGRKEG